MMFFSFRTAAISLAGLLGACAGTGGDYPSLALRDAERVTGSAGVVQAPPPAPAPPLPESVAERIARAVAQAREAHRAFVAGSPAAGRAITAARGSSAPADAWIAAQVTLADLLGLRGAAVIAQADLDLLLAEERLADPGRITPTAQALSDARTQVDGWVEEQDRTIARLESFR